MAVTPSHMIPLGTHALDFALPDVVSGKTLSLVDLKSEKATVIMFICNHCPFVKHLQKELVAVAKEYMAKGVSFIAINSNDAAQYPEDSPQRMKEIAEEWGFPFPYLHDETQSVARAYEATCTPDFFVFDKDLKCTYRGQFDESRPKNGLPITGKDLKVALDCLLKEVPVPDTQHPSIGCNIKWKA
jgi:thiol-disulfide isomerase/thioredoxin